MKEKMINDYEATLLEISLWGDYNGDFRQHAKNALIRNKGITVEEARKKSFPDGGGKYLIDGKWMRVHCDEYHMHRFDCLVEIKEVV